MTNSSLSLKLLELSTLNISGRSDILKKDILRSYGNLNTSSMNSKTSEYAVSEVK